MEAWRKPLGEFGAAFGRNPRDCTTKSTKHAKGGMDLAIQRLLLLSFALFVTFVVSVPKTLAGKTRCEDSVYRRCSDERGSFMLRNALAISLALDIDDGELGF
jgi:hypothetical protein